MKGQLMRSVYDNLVTTGNMVTFADLVPLVDASVKERRDALSDIQPSLEAEDTLMALGALSSLSAFGNATIPEPTLGHLYNAAMHLAVLRRAVVDKGERL